MQIAPLDTPPRSAILLGWLGFLPFAAAAALTVSGTGILGIDGRTALVTYAGLILAFMGGVQWGIEISHRREDLSAGVQPSAAALTISTLPQLTAFFAMLLLQGAGLLIALAASFVALAAYDTWRAREGYGPAWYPSLRWPLTLAVTVSLLAAAFLAPNT